MRIEIDRDRCIGIGICEGLAPEAFEVRDDGSVALLDGAAGTARDGLEAAVAACPTAALALVEDR